MQGRLTAEGPPKLPEATEIKVQLAYICCNKELHEDCGLVIELNDDGQLMMFGFK